MIPSSARLLLSIGVFLIAPNAFPAPQCVKSGSICVDGPSTKIISGAQIYKECWQYQDTYQCGASAPINDCAPLLAKGCTVTSSTCALYAADGTCSSYTYVNKCPDKPASTTQTTVCDTSTFCDSNGACFDTSKKSDTDFAIAAAMNEAQRQAGIYGVNGGDVSIFKGYMSACSVKVLGGMELNSCCKSSGGGAAFSNNSLMIQGISAASAVGSEVLKTGSRYVYDALYATTDAGLIAEGMGAASGFDIGLSNGSTFGAYGFKFSFSMANGFQFTGFDPYSFAAAVAIQMITQWLQCSNEEQTFALKKGQNLCVFVDSYCSNKIPLLNICLEKKEQYCCFNSILAKLINRQGRAQLGMAMNQCGGFSDEQLKAIDFSKLDLSEFMSTLYSKTASSAASASKVNATVQQKVQSYYSQ